MKINFFVNPQNQTKDANYVNVCVVDIGKFDEQIDDNECTEILLYNCLEYILPFNLDHFINTVLKKLAHGGRLVIQSINLDYVCSRRHNGIINEETANMLLYGHGKESWQIKKGTINMDRLCEMFKSRGLEITDRALNGCDNYVECVRV